MRNKTMSALPAALLGLLLTAGTVTTAVAEPNVSERRAIAAYQEGAYVAKLQEVQAAAGFDVPVEVQWNSIALSGYADSYADEGFWTGIFFTPLTQALKEVARDDMGKEALKDKLKSVVVHYNKDTAPASAYEDGVSFADGVLTLNFQPYSNVDDVKERAAAIQKVLEAGL
ncbi:MAG: hypothetical protein V4812_15995 [Pseudomonadota bacterium]